MEVKHWKMEIEVCIKVVMKKRQERDESCRWMMKVEAVVSGVVKKRMKMMEGELWQWMMKV